MSGLLFDDLHNPKLADDAAETFGPSASREALDALTPGLPRLEALVLRCLARVIDEQGREPTAYELFTFMQHRNAARDLNDVRPRLTALRAKGKVVAHEAARACSITGKTAATWALIGG